MSKVIQAPDVEFEPRQLEYDAYQPSKIAISQQQFIKLDNINCVDSQGRVFEHYDKLLVRKHVELERDHSGAPVDNLKFTVYDAATHLENQGLFLPSLALTCNILARLFNDGVRKEANDKYTTIKKGYARVLKQYAATKWSHLQNTLVDWDRSVIIHYPKKGDYNYTIEQDAINQNVPRIVRHFELNNLYIPDTRIPLEEVLEKQKFREYLTDLTGLPDPSILLELGKYYYAKKCETSQTIPRIGRINKAETAVWLPEDGINTKGQTGAWIGYDDNTLEINISYEPLGMSPARGVAAPKKQEKK